MDLLEAQTVPTCQTSRFVYIARAPGYVMAYQQGLVLTLGFTLRRLSGLVGPPFRDEPFEIEIYMRSF